MKFPPPSGPAISLHEINSLGQTGQVTVSVLPVRQLLPHCVCRKDIAT